MLKGVYSVAMRREGAGHRILLQPPAFPQHESKKVYGYYPLRPSKKFSTQQSASHLPTFKSILATCLPRAATLFMFLYLYYFIKVYTIYVCQSLSIFVGDRPYSTSCTTNNINQIACVTSVYFAYLFLNKKIIKRLFF